MTKTKLIIEIEDSEDSEETLELAFHQFAKHFINDHHICVMEDFVTVIIKRCLNELIHNSGSEDFKEGFCVGISQYVRELYTAHIQSATENDILKQFSTPNDKISLN